MMWKSHVVRAQERYPNVLIGRGGSFVDEGIGGSLQRGGKSLTASAPKTIPSASTVQQGKERSSR